MYIATCRKWLHTFNDLETAKARVAQEAIRANRGAQIYMTKSDDMYEGEWKLILTFNKYEWKEQW